MQWQRVLRWLRRSIWKRGEVDLLSALEMGFVRITSWYPNFNGSHVGLPPSEMHRMTGLPPKIVWTLTYSHRPHWTESLEDVIEFSLVCRFLTSTKQLQHRCIYQTVSLCQTHRLGIGRLHIFALSVPWWKEVGSVACFEDPSRLGLYMSCRTLYTTPASSLMITAILVWARGSGIMKKKSLLSSTPAYRKSIFKTQWPTVTLSVQSPCWFYWKGEGEGFPFAGPQTCKRVTLLVFAQKWQASWLSSEVFYVQSWLGTVQNVFAFATFQDWCTS